MFMPAFGDCYELPQDSFYHRVRHNFKIYVLLGLKTGEWNQEDILSKIYELRGYVSHRIIKYDQKWSHLHIKFASAHDAFQAVTYFKQLSSNLSVDLIENMLKAWYQYEKEKRHNTTLTHSIVDIIGSPPHNINLLKESVINEVFIDYGTPYLLPYTAALSETHVQLVFKSMTEALAACMAFGEWYRRDQKCDLFYYRVRINPGAYETLLIESTGGTAEAFKLEYFVHVKTESNANRANRKNAKHCNKFPSNREQNRSRHMSKNEDNLEVNHASTENSMPFPVYTQNVDCTYVTNCGPYYFPAMYANMSTAHLYYADCNYGAVQGITHTGTRIVPPSELDNVSEVVNVSEEEVSDNVLPENQSWVENAALSPNKHMATQPEKTSKEKRKPPIHPESTPNEAKKERESPIYPESPKEEKREPQIQPEGTAKEKREPQIQPEGTAKEKREPQIQPEGTAKEKREQIQPEKTRKEAKEKRATSKHQGASKGNSRMPERRKPI